MSLEDLIAAERATPAEPSSAEAKTIWKRIRNGTGAVVPPLFDVSPASTVVTLKVKVSAALSSVIGKAVVGTALVGTLAGGTAAVVSGGAEPEVVRAVQERGGEDAAPREAKREAKAVAPALAAVPAPELVVVPEVVPAPSVEPPAIEPPASPPAGSKRRAKTPPSTFSDEFALIKRAQRALAKDPNAALAAIAEHERRFPKGSMNEDRFALRALALCKAGRRDEGRRAAKLLEQKFPRSLYVDRVNEACT